MSKIKLKTNSISLQVAFEEFIKSCVIKNLSPTTIHTYKAEIGKFIDFVGVYEPCSILSTATIDSFIYQCRIDNNSPQYICTRIRQVRAFVYYCISKQWCSEFKVTLPKADEVIKEPYTIQELELLIKEPLGTTSFVEYRTWCFINLLLGTGIRLSTALNIKVSDINFTDRCILLSKLKNRKVQIIPMSDTLINGLRKYLSLWDYTNDNYLFPNTQTGDGLKQRTVEEDVARYNTSRGVSKTSIHLFRHTYAKLFILNNGDSLMLQRLLGHSTLTMTNHYVNLYSNDLSKGYNKICPLDNL